MDRETVDGKIIETPVWENSPNSIIVQPQNGEGLKLEETEIWGWAWGSSSISLVEVSTDGGETWQEAKVEQRENFEWQRFSIKWNPKSVGEYCIMTRAIDSKGDRQPLSLRRNQISRRMIFVENSLEKLY